MSFSDVIKIFGGNQFRVLVLQGFWEKYYPTEGRRGDFFQNLYNLAGQWDMELPLPKI